MKNLNYRIILRPEPEGGFTVSVPALPGCITWGATLEEASRMAEDAIQAYLASVAKHGEVILDDSNTFERQLSVCHA
jgi:predicted RNase H-like HicB family nuclease